MAQRVYLEQKGNGRILPVNGYPPSGVDSSAKASTERRADQLSRWVLHLTINVDVLVVTSVIDNENHFLHSFTSVKREQQHRSSAFRVE